MLSSVSFSCWCLAWAIFLLANGARTAADADTACSLKDDEDSMQYLCSGNAFAATFHCLGFVIALVAAAGSVAEQVIGERKYSILALTFAMYSLGLTSEFGGKSQSICDQDVDDDATGTYCEGFGATSTFYCFSAVVALVLMYFTCGGIEKGTHFNSAVTFYTYLAVFALAWMTQLATEANSGCEMLENDRLDMTALEGKISVVRCNGFGFATFGAMVTLICAVVSIAMTVKNRDAQLDELHAQHYMSWFAFFVPYLFGSLVFYGAKAQINCQVFDDDDTESACSGYVGAAVFMTFAVIVCGMGIAGGHVMKLQMRNTSWYLAWGLYFMAYTCYLGGQSAVNCKDLDESDDKRSDDLYGPKCNGYGVGTFFVFVSFVCIIVAVIFEFRAHPGNDFLEVRYNPPGDSNGPAFTAIDDEDVPVADVGAEAYYAPEPLSKDPNRLETQDL